MEIRRKFGMGLAVGLLALAFAALPALAQAANVTLREGSKFGTKLAKGAAIKGFSSNLVFATGIGNLECKENEVIGVVGKNSAEPAEVVVNSARFEATGGGVCATSIPIPGGATAEIEPLNLPWTIQFFANGSSAILEASFEATLRNALNETVGVCTYSAEEIADTFNFNTALTDTITEQPLTGGGTALCPSSGMLTGEFAVTHGSSAVIATTP